MNRELLEKPFEPSQISTPCPATYSSVRLHVESSAASGAARSSRCLRLCSAVGNCPGATPLRKATWGQVKALYR